MQETPTMHETKVTVRSGAFEIDVVEAGSGEDVVFLHGAVGLVWDSFLDGLAERYHVIAPRMPGTGGSTGLEDLLDHHDLFFFYLDLFDALGLDRTHLIGASLGGWIATELAALEPKRFDKLVLLSPIGLWDDDHPLPDIFALLPNELAEAAFHDPNHPAAKAMVELPTDAEALKVATINRAKTMTAAARFIWPIPDKGLKHRIHRVQASTLIVWGKSDGLAPPHYAGEFQRRIAGSQLTMLDDCGHMIAIEQPDKALACVTEFIG